jgi:hypothetical protein
MAKKKFFSHQQNSTEKQAIATFFAKAKKAGISVKRFSVVPVFGSVPPNAERALFKVTALEAY